MNILPLFKYLDFKDVNAYLLFHAIKKNYILSFKYGKGWGVKGYYLSKNNNFAITITDKPWTKKRSRWYQSISLILSFLSMFKDRV